MYLKAGKAFEFFYKKEKVLTTKRKTEKWNQLKKNNKDQFDKAMMNLVKRCQGLGLN